MAINNRIIASSLMIVLLLIVGCTVSQTKYVCSDGTTVNAPEECTSTEKDGSVLQEPLDTEIVEEVICTPDWECPSWSGCSSFGKQTRTCNDKNSCGTTESKPPETQSCTVKALEPLPIVLSGAGMEATSKFRLEKGLSIFNMKHYGSSNFAIWLMDSMGERVDLLVNEIGSFDGTTAVGIAKSEDYILDISADGDWEIEIKQPRPTTASPIPLTLTGNGKKTTEFFSLNRGLIRFELHHIGNSNFAIWLMNNKGERVDLLVNEIGSFDGSKAIGISTPGVYLLSIEADGDWEVSIS